jgi:hypothetical protein
MLDCIQPLLQKRLRIDVDGLYQSMFAYTHGIHERSGYQMAAIKRHTCATTNVTAKPITTGAKDANSVHFLLPVSL